MTRIHRNDNEKDLKVPNTDRYKKKKKRSEGKEKSNSCSVGGTLGGAWSFIHLGSVGSPYCFSKNFSAIHL